MATTSSATAHRADTRAALPVAPAPATGPPTAPARPVAAESGASWWPPVVVSMIGMFLSALDASIVATAVPAIRATFNAGADDAAWVTTAFTAAQAVALPASAWLATRVGLRRVYLVALALFTGCSLLCSVAWSLPSLIVFRALQGVPGALTAAVGLAIIFQRVPPRNRSAALTWYAVGIVAAPGLAPLFAGWVVQHDAWRMIFYVDAPLAVVGAFAALRAMPDTPGRARRYDALGHLSAGAGLCALVVAVNRVDLWGISSYRFLGLCTVGVLASALFVVIEMDRVEPLLDLRGMLRRPYLVLLLVMAVMFAGNTVVAGFVPAFLGQAQGITPVNIGLVLLPQALAWLSVLPLAGWLLPRVGPKVLVVSGLVLVGVGCLMVTGTTVAGDRTALAGWLAVRALGLGLTTGPIMASGMLSLPPELIQDGSTVQALFQRSVAGVGAGSLLAWQSHLGVSLTAERAALTPAIGAESNADLVRIDHAGQPALHALFQQLHLRSSLVAWSDVLLVTGLLTLCTAALALAFTPRRLGA